jgi:GH15 family glucan-1,4-alpha-glucosidase
MPYEPIENYGVIGDLQTVALVGMNGSIDFMCFPHFDSPSIFAALLDHKKGGCFQLAPILRGEHRKQIYFPDTNMLLTRFLSAEGRARRIELPHDLRPGVRLRACRPQGRGETRRSALHQ